eukprot:443567-Amphidinium_carterae.2
MSLHDIVFCHFDFAVSEIPTHKVHIHEHDMVHCFIFDFLDAHIHEFVTGSGMLHICYALFGYQEALQGTLMTVEETPQTQFDERVVDVPQTVEIP